MDIENAVIVSAQETTVTYTSSEVVVPEVLDDNKLFSEFFETQFFYQQTHTTVQVEEIKPVAVMEENVAEIHTATAEFVPNED